MMDSRGPMEPRSLMDTRGPMDMDTMSDNSRQQVTTVKPLKLWTLKYLMSLCMRKPTICICENKDADQLRGNREADQRLCFRYTDSTISLLLISKISSF